MTQSTKKIGYRRKKGAHKAHAASRVVPNKAQHRGRSSSAMVGREDDAGMGGDDDAEIDDNEGDDAKIDDSEDEYEEHAFFPNHDLRLLQEEVGAGAEEGGEGGQEGRDSPLRGGRRLGPPPV